MERRTLASRARTDDLRRYEAIGLQILAVATAYYGVARLGLFEQLVRGVVTPLWPPTGIAVAALLLLGPRVWPGITLGTFFVNVTIGLPIVTLLVIVAGNTLAPVCSYALLRRANFRTEMDRLRDALALVFLGALTGMLVSATVGSSALVVSGVLPSAGFWPAWSVWWTGDAMGVLVIAPVLLVLRSARWPAGASALRWAEAAALLTGTLLAAYLATKASNTLFLVFPFLIWAAFRFRRAGAVPCALLVSTLAIFAATRRTGPFAGHDLLTDMVTLQAFNGAVALTALLLSALITERNRAHEEITRVCARLSDAVATLDPRGTAYRTPSTPRRPRRSA